ncbi:hypothetical protein JCM11251_003151 [Rhodosporidiobolus azoricus]
MAPSAPRPASAALETPATAVAASCIAEGGRLTSTSSTQPRLSTSTTTTAEHVDLLFKRWTAAVAQKMRRKKGKGAARTGEGEEDPPPLNKDEVVEIWRSVFDEWKVSMGYQSREGNGQGKEPAAELGVPEMDHERFLGLVEDVRLAISSSIHPKLNSKGSSGSYFARSPTPPHPTLGIFKPADEDPYAALNPKWLKWLHRNFLSAIVPFGRSCLPPGQSYICEAAASTLDRMLGTNIVPRTEVVSFSSPAFYYDWIDREKAARRGGKLREKDGSFQVFLKGYTDASDFLSKHPYPGRPVHSSASEQANHSRSSIKDRHGRRRRARGCFSCLLCLCGRAGAEKVLEEEFGEGKEEEEHEGDSGKRFQWTEEVVESFREGLECLVILDFLIRNTDRGLDNFMLKPCSSCELPAALSAPSGSSQSRSSSPTTASGPPSESRTHLHLAAIDNSLAFPHTHPSGWRRYPYGWLYLPLSLIGRPWSRETRERFLPMLSDPRWWAEVKVELRKEFLREAGGKGGGKARKVDEMFEKQFALVKGQGLLLVESLRSDNEGPLELCRRPKKLVFDDYALVADEDKPAPPQSESHTPLSFGQAAATLDEVSPPPHRPLLHEQHSEPTPASPSSPVRQLSYSAFTGNKKDKHRRTVSSIDYSTLSGQPLASPHSSPSRSKPPSQAPIFATTTRSPAVAIPISGAAPAAAEAAQLRKPLDSLAASLERTTAIFPKSTVRDEEADETEQEGDMQGAEEEEETGVSLMRRLDRVEDQERKRLKRAEKDTAAKAALDIASSTSTDDAAKGERRSFSHGQPGGDSSRKSGPWKLFRRAVSEEHAPTLGHVDERTALLGGREDEADERDEDEDSAAQSEITVRPPAGGRGMSMSWYGGELRGVAEEGDGGGEVTDLARGKRRKWVVIERVELVKEPKRHWWMWDW